MMEGTISLLRRAAESDQAAIRHMVRTAGLDPTALHWSHFIVAEHDGQIVGIGQIRPYKHCRELGSLVVSEAWRSRGLGTQIVETLLAGESGVVYLECISSMTSYYGKFGFEEIRWWQAPMPLRLKSIVGKMMVRLVGERLSVMRRLPTP
jgi:amino-acid N-acetyltransferase